MKAESRFEFPQSGFLICSRVDVNRVRCQTCLKLNGASNTIMLDVKPSSSKAWVPLGRLYDAEPVSGQVVSSKTPSSFDPPPFSAMQTGVFLFMGQIVGVAFSSREIRRFLRKHTVRSGVTFDLCELIVAYFLKYRRWCPHSISYLARALECSESAVSKAFALLESLGVMQSRWVPVRGGNAAPRRERMIFILKSRCGVAKFARRAAALAASVVFQVVKNVVSEFVLVKTEGQQQPIELPSGEAEKVGGMLGDMVELIKRRARGETGLPTTKEILENGGRVL